ncbi:MFS transporter [Flexivirga endophytica]|uniref:MFS transporter n=1 Tax=Flexivirga endophytica TaxID=1849103 RepID=A0A916TIY4_9MICO|nr:MFS transporter [Flexivirga endophytica]GGB47656.1 MFS transporter [Flexivirga endophytica]GHB60571.1 MFS transporter [Flexivirga endophytica]
MTTAASESPSRSQHPLELPSTGAPDPRHRDGLFASLSNRNFRWFVFGQAASTSGLWTQRVAQDWLVLTLTHNAFMVGIATAMQFVPTLLFGMSAGLVADRFDKRHVLMGTVSTLGLSAAVLGVLCVTDTVQLWHVLVIAFLTGTAACFDNPTRSAFIHEIVGPEMLRNAVSLNSAIFQLGALAGPAVSSGLITAVGTGWAFVATGGWYVIVLAAFFAIRTGELRTAPRLSRAKGQQRMALAEILRRPVLLWPIVLAGVCAFFTTNFAVTLTAFAKDLHLDAGGYGFLTIALALGSLIGALASAKWPGSRLRHIAALAAGLAAGQLLAAFMPNMVTVGAAFVVIGAIGMPFLIATNTLIQLASSDSMRGRVLGVYMLVTLGSAAVGGPVVGLLDQVGGAPLGLITGTVVVGAAAALVSRQLARVGGIEVRDRLRPAHLRARLATTTRLTDHR